MSIVADKGLVYESKIRVFLLMEEGAWDIGGKEPTFQADRHTAHPIRSGEESWPCIGLLCGTGSGWRSLRGIGGIRTVVLKKGVIASHIPFRAFAQVNAAATSQA